MNQKRKAELQRKLTMAPVGRPPEGLADQIKRDIPDSLFDATRERAQLSRSVIFSLRVAASIVLLITSVVFSIRLLSPGGEEQLSLPSGVASAPQPVRESAPASDTAEVMVSMPVGEAKRDSVSIPPAAQAMLPVAAPRRDLQSRAKLAEREREHEQEAAPAGSKQTDMVAHAPAAAESLALAPVAQNAAPPPPAAPAAPPEMVAQDSAVAEGARVGRTSATLSARRERGGLVKSAEAAATLDLSAPAEMFGISIEEQGLASFRGKLQGEAGQGDVEALTNYLAASTAAESVSLEVEGSRHAWSERSSAGLLRISVDTPNGRKESRSNAPVAIEAELVVEIHQRAVNGYRIIGDRDLESTEPALFAGTSATGLIEVDLRPALSPGARVATVQLTYRSLEGEVKTLRRTVSARDLRRSWEASSRRHRRATLGAGWAESLGNESVLADLAAKARLLAEEETDDARAAELAAAISAASRLQSSAPTGNER